MTARLEELFFFHSRTQRKDDMEKLSRRIKEKRLSFPHDVLPEFPRRNLLIEVTNACNH